MGLHSAANVTDNEFDWYTPIAVILKPTSKKDIQTRLPFNFDNHPLPPSDPEWPPVQDTWPLDPLSPYDYARTRNIEQESGDRLREFYETYNLLNKVQSNLLSFARMGLVDVSTKEIVENADGDEQGKLVVQ